MPRKYQRKTTGHPRSQWSEENLIKAMKAMDKGKLSGNQIAQRYRIPPRTLRRHYANKNTKKHLGKHPVLDFDNEDYLAATILKLEKDGDLSLTAEVIRRVAFEFAEQMGLVVPFNKETRTAGRAWLLSFLERHPEVDVRLKCSDNPDRKQDDNEKEAFGSIIKKVEEEVKIYKESLKNLPESRNDFNFDGSFSSSEESDGDPLVVKTETFDDQTNDAVTINDIQECSNEDAVKHNVDFKEYHDRGDLVEVKCDGIDLLFLGYAATLKKLSRVKQITVKHEIAKIFMEAELSDTWT